MADKKVIATTDIQEIKDLLKAELRAELMEDLKKEYEEKASIEEERNEKALAAAEKKMKDILLAQPKKLIHIPDDPLNPSDQSVIIAVNGVIFGVPRGIDIEVPESVAEAWKWSYQQTKRANDRIKVREITELTVSE